MYHRIDHRFFSNPKKPGNAGGGIRIGYYRKDTGRCIVDSYLFMRQDSEPEIVTSKPQENVYYSTVGCIVEKEPVIWPLNSLVQTLDGESHVWYPEQDRDFPPCPEEV